MRLRTKLLIFFLVGLILHAGLVAFTLKAASVYKDGAAIICEQKRKWARRDLGFDRKKASVLFFGFSLILSGIAPEVFDGQRPDGVQSYNLALPSLPIATSYFVLKDVIDHSGAPDYIIMPVISDAGREPGLFDYYVIQGINFPKELTSYLLNRPEKQFAFNYLSPMRLYTHEILRYAAALLVRRSELREMQERNASIVRQMIHDRGYYRIKGDFGEKASGTELAPLAPAKPEHFDIGEDPYVRKFFDLAQQHHIKVFLIELMGRQGIAGPFSEKPDKYAILASLYPNVFVGKNSWQVKIFPDRYFADGYHLNPAGAKLFTKDVFREFADTFHSDQRLQPRPGNS